MPSRKIIFVPGEYYHICNRGIDGKVVCEDERDYARLLFLALYLRSPHAQSTVGAVITKFLRSGKFMDEKQSRLVASLSAVGLLSFALMPNHFHLLVREDRDGGIPLYLQRMENAYTRYYNIRYNRQGHLFQGPFRARHIDTNDQLLYVSAYIHRNPRKLTGWEGKEPSYPWSSYPDYIGHNRWPLLLDRDLILSQFDKKNSYGAWLKTSTAKMGQDELNEEYVDLFNIGG